MIGILTSRAKRETLIVSFKRVSVMKSNGLDPDNGVT